MKDYKRKARRKGLIVFILFALISFAFGVYEIIATNSYTFFDIGITIIGALLAGFLYGFLPIFLISSAYYKKQK